MVGRNCSRVTVFLSIDLSIEDSLLFLQKTFLRPQSELTGGGGNLPRICGEELLPKMAAVAQPVEQVTELLQNLKVDSQSKGCYTTQTPPNLDGNASDGSIEASAAASAGIADSTSIIGAHEGCMDPGIYYTTNGYATPHGFYYGGYECPIGDWDDYSRHVGMDGVEMQTPGVYSENGSVLYHAAGYGYSAQPIYGPYTPGTPMPGISADGQLYGPQTYPYPGHIYQQPVHAGPQFMPPASPVTAELSTASAVEPGNMGGDGSNDPPASGTNATLGPRPAYHIALMPSPGPYGRGIIPVNVPSPGSQDVRVNYEGLRAGAPCPDVTKLTAAQQQRHGLSQPLPVTGFPGQPARPVAPMVTHLPAGQQPRTPSGVGPIPGSLPRVYQPPARMYSTIPGRGLGLGANGLETRVNGRSWVAVDKGKPRGRGNGVTCNGNGSLDILNEQNRGPRITRIRNQRTAPGVLRLTGGHGVLNGNPEALNTQSNKDQYNRSDFFTNYDYAKFFVIKSYSEDDVHKSIKYNVWASTPNGNKKLDAAYKEAQGKAGHCPLFLFFSVNASGQFCGVAEMVGPVDFNKSMDFWQQDKWTGRFPVKWDVIKDVPNTHFRHIILENNDNKPVTNSRDTQEVKYEHGLEMLNLFKNYAFKTSILDDFQFYENRQKAMLEKRGRQQSQQILTFRASESDQRRREDETACEPQESKSSNEDHGNKCTKILSSSLAQAVACNVALCDDGGKPNLRLIEKSESSAAGGVLSDNVKTSRENKDTASGIMIDLCETTKK